MFALSSSSLHILVYLNYFQLFPLFQVSFQSLLPSVNHHSRDWGLLLALQWQVLLLLIGANQRSHWYWKSDFTEFCSFYWKWILLIDLGIKCKENKNFSQVSSWMWLKILKQSIESFTHVVHTEMKRNILLHLSRKERRLNLISILF